MLRITGKPNYILGQLYRLDQDKRYIIQEEWESRTARQNNYLHAIFDFIWKEIWDTKEEVKEDMVLRFWYKDKDIDWIPCRIWKSTTALMKKESFSNFILNVRNFALHTLNLTIPDFESDRIDAFYNEVYR